MAIYKKDLTIKRFLDFLVVIIFSSVLIIFGVLTTLIYIGFIDINVIKELLILTQMILTNDA